MKCLSRRDVFTTTPPAAAAAVPAVASANLQQPATDPLAAQRMRDQGVQELAEHMPADAHTWAAAVRATGSHVHMAADSNGNAWLAHAFAETDPIVTSFLKRCQTARLDAGEIVAELEREQPSENDRRLWDLVPQVDAALAADDTPRVHALDRELRDTRADSASGLLAKLRGYFLDEPLPNEDRNTAHALDGTERLAAICRDIQRLAREDAQQ